MSWASAEVGRPGPARDVLDGGDVDPTTGRLLSVGELQAALRAARSSALNARTPPLREAAQPAAQGSSRPAPPRTGPVAGDGPAAALVVTADAAAAVRVPHRGLRPPAGRRWIAVVGAHSGAGASTIALAVADAASSAGRAVHLVSCSPPARCGLLGAATVELGVDPTGLWRTGRRGQSIALDRPVAAADLATPWPAEPDAADLLTVIDAETDTAQAPRTLATAAAVLLTCRITVRGVQQVEQLLGPLLTLRDGGGPAVLVAAVGPGRWPGAVRGAAGPLLRQLRSDDAVVAVPLDRHLLTYGSTGAPLPRAVTRAGAGALRQLESTGALSRTSAGCGPSSRGSDPRPPDPVHPAPDLPLQDKDADR